jgi:glutaconate CoA-transferase, subunit B
MSANGYSMDEIMTIATSKYMRDRDTLFIGTGLPMVAAYLAKATHAPSSALLFESGVLDPEPKRIAKAVGDPRLVSTARRVSGMVDSLLILHGGRVDLGVLGCAQVDRFGNINTTAVGPGGYASPSTRLPGSGGANDIASMAKNFVIVTRHNKRTFVEKLDYLTTPGFLTGPGARERAGLRGGGPVAVVTDKCVLEFDGETREMFLKSVHPGVSVDDVQQATGFQLVVPDDVPDTAAPTPEELHILRTRIDPEGVYL